MPVRWKWSNDDMNGLQIRATWIDSIAVGKWLQSMAEWESRKWEISSARAICLSKQRSEQSRLSPSLGLFMHVNAVWREQEKKKKGRTGRCSEALKLEPRPERKTNELILVQMKRNLWLTAWMSRALLFWNFWEELVCCKKSTCSTMEMFK